MNNNHFFLCWLLSLIVSAQSFALLQTNKLHRRSSHLRIFNKRVNDGSTAQASTDDPFWRSIMIGNEKSGQKLVKDEQNYNTLLQPHRRASKNHESRVNPQTLLPIVFVGLLATIGAAVSSSLGITLDDAISFGSHLLQNPQETLQDVVTFVQELGPLGPLYFGLIYLVAEILAVPATPLAMSAGYLFGVAQGTAVVLVAATIAASVGFVIGKTFLRGWVETQITENPKFQKLDTAIGREGFKLLLLVRLSPIFPFSLSNYLYGASSIDFTSYFWGTLVGFAPGTLAYVYTGTVGKALTVGEGAQPWYVYAAGLAVLVTILKLITDVATKLIDAIDEPSTP